MVDAKEINMKVEIKEIYKCDHCNKLYQVKGAAERHEKSCHRNPDNERPCFGCNHFSGTTTTQFIDHPYSGQHEREVKVSFCGKKDSFLYPPKVEHKGNALDLGIDSNIPMPRTCESFTENRIWWRSSWE